MDKRRNCKSVTASRAHAPLCGATCPFKCVTNEPYAGQGSPANPQQQWPATFLPSLNKLLTHAFSPCFTNVKVSVFVTWRNRKVTCKSCFYSLS